MRRILFFATLTFTVFFSACSKDDANTVAPGKELILGEWVLKNVYSEKGKLKYSYLGKTIVGEISVKGSDFRNTQKFTDNPNEFVSTGGMKLSTTLTILFQTETNVQEIPNSTEKGTWSLVNDELTIKKSENFLSSTLKINSLTDSTLVLSQDLTVAKELIEDIDNVEINGNLVFVYERK